MIASPGSALTRLARLGCAASCLALLVGAALAPQASAVKYFDSAFGGTGSTGGLFSSPRDIAINEASAPAQPQDGWSYVVDQANHRIQAFDADHQFQWAIGRNVIKASPTGGSTDLGDVSEKCTVAEDCQAGATGSLGGEFNNAQGIDIDQATGHLFVRERNSNARVQEFTADGAFVRTFGWDVVQPGGDGESTTTLDEQERVTITPPLLGTVTGGSFTLSFGVAAPTTTVAIAWNADAQAVEDALVGLGGIGPGDVDVTGGPGGAGGATFTVTFAGALGGTDINPPIAVGANNLTGGGLLGPSTPPIAISTPRNGGPAPGFETCTVAAQCKAGTTGNIGSGHFGSSTTAASGGIAVAPGDAPNAGELFVADPGNRRVQRFTVPANPTGSVVPGTPFGTSVEFASNQPTHVATDSNGVVYASDGATGSSAQVRIIRFGTGQSAFLSPILGNDSATNVLNRGGVRSMEVDDATGNLFVGRNPADGIMELDVSDNPAQVGPGDLVGASGADLNIGNPEELDAARGIGINATSGEMLVTTAGTGAAGSGVGHRVLVLDDDGIDPPPTVTLLPAEDVGCSSVTVRAEINPNGPTGFPTSYQFEVSKTGLPGDWLSVGAEGLVGATGDGDEFEPVAQPVAGLEANTPLYRFRVRTIRRPGQPAVVSPPQLFATAPCPPTVETLFPQQTTDSSAQLVGRLNPNGLTTSYWFEWGDTEYGNTVPVPAGSAGGGIARLVSETLSGLRPDATYHYRLCAQNALAASKVCGVDRVFETRVAAAGGGQRAYEMVSSPDKVLRRGGNTGGQGLDITRFADALPARSGEAVMWGVFAGGVDPDAGAGFARDIDYELRQRQPGGWRGQAVTNIPMAPGVSAPVTQHKAVSSDLRTQLIGMTPSVFPSGGGLATRVIGDTGGPLGAGWYPFTQTDLGYGGTAQMTDDGSRFVVYNPLTPDDGFLGYAPSDGGLAAGELDPPQTAGSAMLLGQAPTFAPIDLVNECTGSWAPEEQTVTVNATGGAFSLSVDGLETASIDYDATAAEVQSALLGLSNIAPGDIAVSGDAAGPWTVTFLSNYAGVDLDPMASNATALTGGAQSVTVETSQNGSEGDATLVPQRHHSGTDATPADDIVADRPCGAGSPVDVRGAGMGSGRLDSPRSTHLSDDGRRVVFMSTPFQGGDGQGASLCAESTGAATACPQQLFIREYDTEGNAIVRWISRPEDDLFDARQQIGLLGNGVAFEGASRTGDIVYFRSNAVLTADDPNGARDGSANVVPPPPGGMIAGSASPNSWDLYRYEVPPAGLSHGNLIRVTAGPTGGADPNTNCAGLSSGECGSRGGSIAIPNGEGAAVRFLSDDGQRVYFVTTGRIPGALNEPPAGGDTVPTQVNDQINDTSRNLYLYDARKPDAAAYEFVARVPWSGGAGLNDCASADADMAGPPLAVHKDTGGIAAAGGNCVHGSSSGDGIVFATDAALTSDDVDGAADVYLYEAIEDRLTRLTAPQVGATPYVCVTTASAQPSPLLHCNGDLGMYRSAWSTLPLGGGFVGFEGLRGWNVSEDAEGHLERAYFQSRLPLAAGAAANDRMKVYEWHREGGRLSLVSPPGSSSSAFYTGNSEDGDDVFFWTEQRLSGWEIDDGDGDIYNATLRPDVVPEPVSAPAGCAVLAGGCNGPAAAVVGAPTPTAEPGGIARRDVRTRLVVGKLGKAARRKAARSGTLVVRVRSGKAGRVTVKARAKVGGKRRLKRRLVAQRRVRVAAGRPTTVRLRLNSRARRVLRNRRALRLSIGATMDGVARPGSLTLVLRRPR